MHGERPVPSNFLSIRSYECVDDSGVVGHCTADLATGEIVGLSVDYSYRRQGIARKLLSLIVDLMGAAGVRRVWLTVSGDPALPALKFYRAVGWRQAGEDSETGDLILEPPMSTDGDLEKN